ncbi:MAG: CHAT domain-containing protein [Planctomycetota bacterium]
MALLLALAALLAPTPQSTAAAPDAMAPVKEVAEALRLAPDDAARLRAFRGGMAPLQRSMGAFDYDLASAIVDVLRPHEDLATGLMALDFHLFAAHATAHVGRYEVSHRHCDALDELLEEKDFGPNQAEVLGQVAEARYRLGRSSSVRRLLDRAEADYEDGDRVPVTVWRTRGFMASHEGEHAVARDWFDRLVQHQAGAGRDSQAAGALVLRGREQRMLRDLEAARDDFGAALELALAGEFRNVEAGALDGLSRVALAEGDLDGALDSIEACLAIEREEGLVDYLPDSLQAWARIAIARGDVDAARSAIDEARAWMESSTLLPLDRARLRSRFAEWGEIAQDLTLLELGEATESERAACVDRGLARASEWRGRLFLTRLASRPEDLGESLGRSLGGDEILVRYAEASEQLVAYVASASGTRALDLGPRAEVEALARSYVDDICAGTSRHSAADVVTPARELYRRLVEPVLSTAGSAPEHIVVVPSDQLAALPFHALVAAPWDETKGLDGVRFLADERVVATSPSLPVFIHLRTVPPRAEPGRALFLGDTIVPQELGGLADTHRLADEVGGMPRLSGSRREVVEIAFRRLDPATRVAEEDRKDAFLGFDAERSYAWRTDAFDLLLGKDAGPAALAGDLRSFSEVHIACHGFTDPNDPGHRGLVLSGDDEGEDGLVDLDELRTLHLDAELVVLSGCSTGRGQLLPGEGTRSVAAALHEAGARAVVASLWRVDDERTANLMVAMGRERARGASTCDALARAQFLQRRGSGTRTAEIGPADGGNARDHPRHPSRWAAFVYSGSSGR